MSATHTSSAAFGARVFAGKLEVVVRGRNSSFRLASKRLVATVMVRPCAIVLG
jgi:hypothetical protein